MISQESPCALFEKARAIFSQEVIAEALGKDVRTIRRWERRQTPVHPMAVEALRGLLKGSLLREEAPAYGTPRIANFSFIDLFAGIGGTRLAVERAGGRCVFTSEWDRFACLTYRKNHVDDHEIRGDITKVPLDDVPPHDVLVGGFPCQPFSLAGVSKKNSLGRAHGFADETQGTLFFEIAKILKERKPAAFLLENVKHLQRHDRGRTFEVIRRTLEELGYVVSARVIDAACVVPQHRERIFIVGFREERGFSWSSLPLPPIAEGPTLGSILHKQDEEPEAPFTISERGRTRVSPRYVLSDHLWDYLQRYAEKHRLKGNGFGCSVVGPDDVARTLSARYHKDGSEILIACKNGNPRRLTPRECARLMGFPDTFQIPVSDTQAYRQFGNSVVVPVVEAVAKCIAACLAGQPLPPRLASDNQLVMPGIAETPEESSQNRTRKSCKYA